LPRRTATLPPAPIHPCTHATNPNPNQLLVLSIEIETRTEIEIRQSQIGRILLPEKRKEKKMGLVVKKKGAEEVPFRG
jgi:hypothetical protein